MQSECDFEVLPPAGGAILRDDIVWLYSAQGVEWALSQKPKSRPLPRGEERNVVVKHLQAFMRKMSNNRLEELSAGRYDRDLWDMPYGHTTYVSDVNAYWQWYQNVRPGHESGRLSDMLEARDMLKICRTIARERKALRLKSPK